jgi:uncharacterized protein YndB with AHSA1/START domain
MDGTLEQAGERWRLTFVRKLAHSPEKVWRALTEPEHLVAWFPSEIHGDRVPGAKLRFVFRHDEGPPSEGEMLVYDPPRALEFRWEDDVLRFDLRPDGDGCVLTFVDTFAEHGKASRDGAGWHACLDVLEYHLAGEDPPDAARTLGRRPRRLRPAVRAGGVHHWSSWVNPPGGHRRTDRAGGRRPPRRGG